MTNRSKFLKSCAHLLADRGGNFAMMAAIVAPVLIAGGGVAMDMANMTMSKSQLQAATDSAALAASSALANEGITLAQAKLTAKDYLKAHMRNSSSLPPEEMLAWEAAMDANTTVDATEEKSAAGNAKTYVVKVTAKFDLPLNAFTGLLGKKSAQIGAASQSSSSTEAKNALSMFLVLDRSGSMGENTDTTITTTETSKCNRWSLQTCTREVTRYVTKIEALKDATDNLLSTLKTADTNASLVRTGGVSYNDAMQTETKLAWGTTALSTYVNVLTATGGTDSSSAFKMGYNSLMATNASGAKVEEKAHADKNKQTPKKFIVFMTDGENNFYNNRQSSAAGDASDTETLKYCAKAKADGIEVYSVAFMAPDNGKTLLKSCASGTDHYFAAEDADQLAAAFKYIAEKASEMSVRLTQ